MSKLTKLTPEQEKRIEEVQQSAERLRDIHKVAGGVCVLFLEADACPFGFALPQGLETEILTVLPGRLRAVADAVEQGDHSKLKAQKSRLD
jgi:hypothetical protein